MCFCTVIPAGALACFHREVALKENSSLFQDTTARGLACHSTDVLWAHYGPWVSKGASLIQHGRLCQSPLRDLSKSDHPAKY